jgi:hypothetical protein
MPDFKGPTGVLTMFATAGGERVRIVTWTVAATPGGGGSGTAPDATTSTNGLVRLANDLGGTASAPTVPGLAGKAAAVHTHTAAQISDAGAVGRTALQASTQAAARTAIGAGVDTAMTQSEALAGSDTSPRQITAAVLRAAIAGTTISGTLSYAQLPPGDTLTFDYARGGFGSAPGALPSSRPTVRTDITIVWTVPFGVDVTAVAIPSDKVDYY